MNVLVDLHFVGNNPICESIYTTPLLPYCVTVLAHDFV